MMRLAKLTLVLGVAVALAVPALAQPPGGGFGRGMMGGGMGGAMLLRAKPVQDDLKMDAAQVEKITQALDKVNEDLRDERAKLRDRDTPREEREAIMKKTTDAQTKAVNEVLKADQQKRLKQIQRQLAGISIFGEEEIQTALKLNDDQKDKIKAIQEDLTRDTREVFQGGGGGGGGFNPEAMRENMKKIQGLRKEALTNAMKVLTADQKTAVAEITGKPVDFKAEDLMGAFGGRGGPGKPGGGKPGNRPGRPGKPGKPDENKGKIDF